MSGCQLLNNTKFFITSSTSQQPNDQYVAFKISKYILMFAPFLKNGTLFLKLIHGAIRPGSIIASVLLIEIKSKPSPLSSKHYV